MSSPSPSRPSTQAQDAAQPRDLVPCPTCGTIVGKLQLDVRATPPSVEDERALERAARVEFDRIAWEGGVFPVAVGNMQPGEAARLAFVAGARWQARAALKGAK